MLIHAVSCYKDNALREGHFCKNWKQPRFLFGSGMSRSKTTHSSQSPEVKVTVNMDVFSGNAGKYAGKGLGEFWSRVLWAVSRLCGKLPALSTVPSPAAVLP